MLERTLQLARRRRLARDARRAASVLVFLARIGLLGLLLVPLPSRRLSPSAKPYELVRTTALADAARVHTELLPAACRARSEAGTPLVTITAFRSAVRQLSDEELLELAGANAAVLVRDGPGTATLVFANPPADRGEK